MSAAARAERTSVREFLFSPETVALAAADSIAELQRTDTSAMQLLQQRGWPEPVDGERWLDTRPALDVREVGQAMVDQVTLALWHALQRGLVERHPQREYLIRTAARRLA